MKWYPNISSNVFNMICATSYSNQTAKILNYGCPMKIMLTNINVFVLNMIYGDDMYSLIQIIIHFNKLKQ